MAYRHISTMKLKTRSEDNAMRIEGYFIVYDAETMIFEGYFEKIARGACDSSIKNNDIVCLFNHDSGAVLGRISSGTLELRSDEKGVFGSVLINPDDTEAVNIYHRIERGDIAGCSFGFNPKKETPEYREDGTHWTVNEADVMEISVCTFPAYEQTEIKARSKDAAAFSKESLKERKAKLRKKLEGIKHGSTGINNQNET